MDDASYAAAKARLVRLLEKWASPLGLGTGWRITVHYEREGIRPDDAQAERGERALFEVNTRWQYLTASIKASMPDVAETCAEDVEWAFVHELTHILINECRYMDQKDWLAHEERVCSTLANAFLGTYTRCRERYEVPMEPGVAYGDEPISRAERSR